MSTIVDGLDRVTITSMAARISPRAPEGLGARKLATGACFDGDSMTGMAVVVDELVKAAPHLKRRAVCGKLILEVKWKTKFPRL